jgi:hypothetical protein
MKKNKSSWIVEMRCVVIKDVCCNDCTIEEAENNPWDFAVDESERYQEDWEVVKVTENI